MARILLVSCNTTSEPYPVYPLGMSMVAHAARRAGHEVREWDVLFSQEDLTGLDDLIEEFEPEIAGISLRNIDNTDSVRVENYLERHRSVVRHVRELAECPVVLGGAGFSLFPDRLLAELGADYGVVGEGESAFLDLLERFEQGFAPPQHVWCGDRMLDAEKIATQRDPELAQYYLTEGGMLNVQTKRGCPHHCAYCTYPLLEGASYRFRPPSQVADEVEELRDRHGADYFAFTDSVFNDAQGRYLEIAEELVRREIRVPWMAFFRPQKFTPDEVDLLYRSGLRSAEWGTDCACDRTLEAMGKGFAWEDVIAGNNAFVRAGVANAHFLIFGGPGEDRDTVDEGLRNIAALERCVVFAFRGVRILPLTGIHRIAVEEGVVGAEDDLLDPCFYHSPGIEPDDLHERLLKAFEERPDRIYPPGQDRERIQVFHRLGYRGPIWDLLLRDGDARGGRTS